MAKQSAVEALRIKDADSAKKFKLIMSQSEARSKDLEDAVSNPWQAPPETSVKYVSKNILVRNEDLKPGEFEISFGKSSGLIDKKAYVIELTFGDYEVAL